MWNRSGLSVLERNQSVGHEEDTHREGIQRSHVRRTTRECGEKHDHIFLRHERQKQANGSSSHISDIERTLGGGAKIYLSERLPRWQEKRCTDDHYL
jgi:hypothetical protein